MLGNLFQPTYEVNMVTKSGGMVMRRMREEGDGNCDVDIMLFSTMIAITIYSPICNKPNVAVVSKRRKGEFL